MKKQDFIQELAKALAPIDAQSRAEILADINEHFAEGAAQGQTEEEICKKLGQPGQIAEQVLEEYSAYRAKNTGNSSGYGFVDIGDIVSSAMEAADIGDIISSSMEAADIGDIISSSVGDIGDIISSSMEAANIKGIISSALEVAAEARRDSRNARRNANNGNGPHAAWQSGEEAPWPEPYAMASGATRIRGGYEINIDESFADVTGIDVSFNMSDIKLLPAQQTSNVRVVIKGKSRYNAFEVANKNGLLYIRQREPFFKFELFGFKTTLDVTIYVPAGFAGDIKASSSVGDISASDISGNLRLSTSAGDVEVHRHTADRVYLRSSAGDVSILDCLVKDINAKSSAGDVKAHSQEVTGLALGSSAGDVDVKVDALYGNAELSTSAGDVNLEARDVQGNITARSSAGSVNMLLPKDVNCRIDVKKHSLGSFTNQLNGNPSSPYTLRASSSVGSIVLEALRQN